MSSNKSEKIIQDLIATYKAELGKQFLAFTLQTAIHNAHRDIDYAVFLQNINGGTYEKLAKINAKIEKKYNITLDMFLYEIKSFRDSINPWSAKIVQHNTKAVYGKNFWSNLSYSPKQIFQGAFIYLNGNREKFLRYIKNISHQEKDWIVLWALDHLFVAVKIYNSLFGFWSLGKERNLSELASINSSLARRVGSIYGLHRNEAVKNPIKYLAECYAVSEYIAKLAGRRTLIQFTRSYKK